MEKIDSKLFKAIEDNDIKLSELLIRAVANVEARDVNNNYETSIFKATSSAMVEYLVNSGADVNARNIFTDTPLLKAAYHQKNEVAKALIEVGADVNAKNSCGMTPLFYAAMNYRDDIVKDLIEAGADIHVKNLDGETVCQHILNSKYSGRVKLAELIETHAIKVEKAKLQTTTPAPQVQPIKKRVKAYI